MLSKIILLSAILLALVFVLAYFIIRYKKRKSTESFNEVVKDLESKLVERLDESATDLVAKFKWYFQSDESPYNRAQRRRIKRHYKKFLWAWPDLTKHQQNADYICHYLSQYNRNKFLVRDYKKLTTKPKKKKDE